MRFLGRKPLYCVVALPLACGARSAPGGLDEAAAVASSGGTHSGDGDDPATGSNWNATGGANSTSGGGTGASGGTAPGDGGASTGSGGSIAPPTPGQPPPIQRLAQFEPAFLRGLGVDPSSDAVYLAGYVWTPFFGTTSLGSKDAYLARLSNFDTLDWIQRFGTSSEDGATTLSFASSGVLYVGGHTKGGLAQPPVGALDVFVQSFDTAGAAGNVTEFGSAEDDWIAAIAEGPMGQLCLTGYANGQVGGADFAGQADLFVAQLDSSGEMLWTEQFGSAGNDRGTDVLVADDGSIFVTGHTDSDFMGMAAAGGFDGFLMRLSPSRTFDWIAPFASSGDDFVAGIRAGPAGELYVVGRTEGELDTVVGGSDAFVAALGSSGELLWLQQFGSVADELVFDLEVSQAGDIYVSGLTNGQLHGQASAGGGDAFVTKLDAQGQIQWSLQFGTAGVDRAMRLDSTDVLYVAGEAGAPLSPGADPNGGVFLMQTSL